MKDYLFVYPKLLPTGGGEAAAAWMLHALCERGTVSVVTSDPHDLPGLDRAFGTSLRCAKLEMIVARSRLCDLFSKLSLPHELLKFRMFVQTARKQRAGHRVCVSAYNDLDLGGGAPVIQYLHGAPCNYLEWVWSHTITLKQNWRMRLQVWLYVNACNILVPWSDARAGRNWTIANSSWTDGAFERIYGRPADAVLFPPPLGDYGRQNVNSKAAFVALARAHPHKGWQEMIDIIKALRRRGHEIGFSMFVIPDQEDLLEHLQNEVEENSEWMALAVNAPREKINEAINTHRYGLHASYAESFGMSIAEMLLGQCLTVVRDEGGQPEIVTEPELRFSSTQEAIEKLHKILSQPELENKLRASQQSRREQYTRERFLSEFHKRMDEFEARFGASIDAG